MFVFPDELRKAYEAIPLPQVFYQFIDEKVVPVLVSDGFCRLVGMDRFAPDPLSIIIADCDYLKRVNDTCGHLAGDEYIRSCAELLRFTLPKEALIFRTGGDEFAAFLPGTGAEEAERLIRRIRENAGKFSIEGIPLSVSVGCSTMTGEKDLKRYIGMADHNMYEEKEAKKRQ